MNLLVVTLTLLAPEGRVVTLSEALSSTRNNNITWQALGENLKQAEAGKSIGLGLFLPKLFAEGSWTHLGERNLPDFSELNTALGSMGALMEDVTAAIVEEHPGQIARFIPYLDTAATDLSGFSNTIESFVPVKNSLAATFSLVVPVFRADSIASARGLWDQFDAAIHQIGRGREQLLYGVAKLYYGLVTLQSLLEVTDRAIETAREHLESTEVRARLRTATELEVRRAELEVLTNEGQRVALATQLERAKAKLRYLTGISGEFSVREPDNLPWEKNLSLAHWMDAALAQRQDLMAARIQILVAEHDLGKEYAKYAPAVDLIGAARIDNNEAQRFDDDPFSWTVLATVSLNIWDGGIREAQADIARSKLRQAVLAVRDNERRITQEVTAAFKVVDDARSANRTAEKQLQVARAAQELAQAAEQEGVGTYLEVIDANTMAERAEGNLVARRLAEQVAILELLEECGEPVPWKGAETAAPESAQRDAQADP